MTTNVTVSVPPHVDRVLISFENFDLAHGWVPGGSQMVNAGHCSTVYIHDMRRISSIAEIKDDPASKLPASGHVTINEHAHGDDAHRSLSNG